MRFPLQRLTTGLLLALVLAATGCSTDKSPMASASNEAASADGKVYLRLTADGVVPAGKTAGLTEGRTVSKKFYPNRSGSMSVEDLAGRGVRDDLKVTFSVDKGDMPYAETITMTVYGNTTSDLVLAFDPAGLVFDSSAKLTILIGAERVDSSLLDLKELLFPFSSLDAYHEHDGTTESASITSIRLFKKLLFTVIETTELLLYDFAIIEMDVPGFSRYGLRS